MLGLKEWTTTPGATHNLLTIPPDKISNQRELFKTQLIWPSTLFKNFRLLHVNEKVVEEYTTVLDQKVGWKMVKPWPFSWF